jgi:hypothetical protein
MAWDYEVGMRVVCINDSVDLNGGWPIPPSFRIPVKGGVYTITAVAVKRARWDGVEALVIELLSDFPELGHVGFVAACFRPVRPTSIEQFRVHLAPKELEKA